MWFELGFPFCICGGGGGGGEFLAKGGGLEFNFFFGDAVVGDFGLAGGMGEGEGR